MSCEVIANGRRYGCGDGDACTADKQIGVPAKRVVREEVPYHDGSYDFSAMDGEVHFDDRELEYTFLIMGDEKGVIASVSELSTWLYGIQDDDIWDTDIPYWHFHGSCDKVKVKYDETGLAAEVVATLVVHPFLIADSLSEFELVRGENYVLNPSRSARIFLSCVGEATITTSSGSQTSSGDVWLDIDLPSGQNVVMLEGCDRALMMWREERL